jgi:hypothetical protein
MSMLSDQPHLVFFSRGKGRGHAIPDAAIAGHLRTLAPDAKITFVSHSMGAATLKGLGWETIDLDLPEDNPLWDTVVRSLPVLRELAPTLVASHEECIAIPLSKALGLPAVYLTDWLLSAEAIQTQSLKYADEVIFLDEPGYYDIPRYLAGKVVHVGPVLRRFPSAGFTRAECRAELGLPPKATVVVVVPGGAAVHSEAFAPVLDLVLRAYESLDCGDRRLIWVAGSRDGALVAKRAGGRADIIVMSPHDTIARTMMAATLVITKGNRITVLECEALGVPSISISSGNNPFDDQRIARVRTNVALRARGLEACLLRQHMMCAVAMSDRVVGRSADAVAAPALAAAKRLQFHLQRPP